MVPVGVLAADVLAEPPFLAQVIEPRSAQELRAAACPAKEADPTQQMGDRHREPGGSWAVPPGKVLGSYGSHRFSHGGTWSEASLQPT